MQKTYNIEEVEIGDFVDFKTPENRVTSAVKEVNRINRIVRINYFEDPDLAIDRVDKWIGFDELYIIKKVTP